MKVIEILKDSANLLGLIEQRNLLSTEESFLEPSLLADEEIATLFNLFKFSARELCTNYVPICQKEQITTVNSRYPVSNLSNYLRISNAYLNGECVPHKILNRYIVFEKDGTYEVEYFTYPQINSLFEEIDFLSNFSPEALVYGLCAYYSLSRGLFAEFESFHDRYKERAESLKDLKVFTLPQRRWQ